MLSDDESPVLPPEFSARFFATDKYLPEPDLGPYIVRYGFRIPKDMSDYQFISQSPSASFSTTLDVSSSLATDTVYPTARRDSDFRELGKSNVFELAPLSGQEAGLTLSLDSLTPVEDPAYADPSGPYKLYSLKGSSRNLSHGYDSDSPAHGLFDAFMLGDDGGLYLPSQFAATQTTSGRWELPFLGLSGFDARANGLGYAEGPLFESLGPDEDGQFEIALLMRREVSKAKLVLPQLGNSIFNLSF